ncbi:ABC transporter permease [Streptomyces sp. NPDC092369]|uniref:ABC transporter permease n=1 Tax=Streptomyces sp. NPDC092369 TaxID=3366015 RepID=UPI0037F8F1CF
MLKATLRSFLAHKGRLLLSALAIVLSVAFVAGSLIFSDTVTRTFDRLFASTSADVTVEAKDDLKSQVPTGEARTVPAALADRVAKVDGVASAHADVSVENITVVDSRNKSVGPTTGAPTIASDWFLTDRSAVKLTSGHAPEGGGEALLDADTADRKHVKIGDTLTVLAQPGTFKVEIVGIATFTTTNPGAALVFLDPKIAATQLLGSADKATGISVDAANGVSDTVLEQRVAAVVGTADYEVRTADEQAKSAAADLGGFLDIIKYVMLGFAGIAVLVGVFLIVNTFSMLIAQRTRELGLLRALGADRRQVRRSVLTEAILLGVVGSTLGLGAGIGLAAGLIKLMSAFGMNLKTTEMVVGWGTPVAAYVVGIGVTFVAAYLPARRAAGVSPMAALADAEIAEIGRPLRTRAIVGSVLGVLGAAALAGCATATKTASSASFLGLGIVLTLLATVVAGPLLVRPVIRVLGAAFPAIFGSIGRMSQRNALRNPRRTGDTAAALAPGALGMDVDFAKDHKVKVGDTIPVEFPGGQRTQLKVGALTDQDGSDGFGMQGGLFLAIAAVEKYVPGGQDSALYVNASSGTSPDQLRKRLDTTLDPYPQVQVRDLADYKKLVHDQIAVLLYLVYALLGLAIVIAVLGVVNTLALSVVERTREIGLLRAIGLARRQLRRMIRLESVVIAVFGAVLGLALGLVWGVCTQQVLALQGMNALAVPWTTIVEVVVGSAVVGVVAALLPALRASRMNVLAAIAHE